MIPNIFVSSTIADLRYLRDGLRDAILELQYRPVMSEYGDVGYIEPVPAADACYKSVSQCHMVVFIVGRRYGSPGADDVSVTHNEFRAARKANLPTITFVDPFVMSAKEVSEATTPPLAITGIREMDNPAKTFLFVNEIMQSSSYNAVIPFTSVSDAKVRLKQQIAHFVGDRLGDVTASASGQIREILAEVSTLRKQLAELPSGTQQSEKYQRYLTATRSLLEMNSKNYREFLEKLFGDIGVATDAIIECANLNEVIAKAGTTMSLVDDINFGALEITEGEVIEGWKNGVRRGYAIMRDRTIRMTPPLADEFERIQRSIISKLNLL